MRQVLLNLTGNAVKFTSKGEVAVTVSLDRSGAGAPMLHFTVRDTGVGIPPEKQGKLFQAFEQADSSITRQYGGTGLGLAISLRIVQLMGGRIWMESTAGRGLHISLHRRLHNSRQSGGAVRAGNGSRRPRRAGAHHRRQRHESEDSGRVDAALADGAAERGFRAGRPGDG